MAAITVDGLSRSFGEIRAVDNVSFRVGEGEVFGLLGPNGAGKTTTIRMLACLISPTSGTATVLGSQIGKGAQGIRARIGLLPESPGLYKNMTAYQNLDFYAKLYGVPADKRRENIEKYLKLFEIWDRRDDAVATFSKGMAQKVAIARALVHEPRILFLDEPTAGLDPKAAKIVNDSLMELRKQRITIFLNTHNLHQAQMLCDRVAILKSKIVAIGSPQELERSLWTRETIVELEKVTPDVLKAIKAMRDVKGIKQEGGKLVIDVDDPERSNPGLVEKIVKAGGRIKFVAEKRYSLEDVYLELIENGP
jgi:ABC-2 type transport system ATP-binding protein